VCSKASTALVYERYQREGGSSVLDFVERDLKAMAPDLSEGGRFKDVSVIYRVDPMLGNSTRLIQGSKLQPSESPEYSLVSERDGFCPFCHDTVDSATFPFPTEMVPGGKISLGRSKVVPNILAYSTYSAVGIYDTARHFLTLSDFDQALLADAFKAMGYHTQMVRRYDPQVEYSSINANYLPASGSSLIHPHLQSSNDYVPLTTQRLFLQTAKANPRSEDGRTVFDEYVKAAKEMGRAVADTGRIDWITPFAPLGFHEVWAVFKDLSDLTDLTDYDFDEIAYGLSKVLAAYSDENLSSFNFSLQGGGHEGYEVGYRLNLRIVSRSPLQPLYRSDVTYFERLGLEAMIDLAPELWAQKVAEKFS